MPSFQSAAPLGALPMLLFALVLGGCLNPAGNDARTKRAESGSAIAFRQDSDCMSQALDDYYECRRQSSSSWTGCIRHTERASDPAASDYNTLFAECRPDEPDFPFDANSCWERQRVEREACDRFKRQDYLFCDDLLTIAQQPCSAQ